MAPGTAKGRAAVAGLAAGALAAGGWLWARHGPDYHEHVSAASGTYPAALGTAPPDAPDRLLRRTADTYGIVGALSVDEIADPGLRKDGDAYDGGEILDPADGKVYKSKLTVRDGGRKLDVRGYVGVPMLGRSQVWLRQE